jgi:hypothetical protein
MQIFFLMLPLLSPKNDQEEQQFFPPALKAIIERKAPATAEEFPSFAKQLERDAADFRAHVDQLAAKDQSIAERVRSFKEDLAKPLEIPTHIIKPLTAYSRGTVLPLNHKYYQIDSYAVIRERGQMKIIGIRFFSRLF